VGALYRAVRFVVHLGVAALMAPPLEPSVAGLFANHREAIPEAALRSALPGPKLPTRDPLI
jgi:hypothetical protein